MGKFAVLAPVVRKVDSAIHRINLWPVDSEIGFRNTHPMDSDYSVDSVNQLFEQVGPGPQINSGRSP